MKCSALFRHYQPGRLRKSDLVRMREFMVNYRDDSDFCSEIV